MRTAQSGDDEWRWGRQDGEMTAEGRKATAPISAPDVLRHMQLTGVYDNMRAQALRRLVGSDNARAHGRAQEPDSKDAAKNEHKDAESNSTAADRPQETTASSTNATAATQAAETNASQDDKALQTNKEEKEQKQHDESKDAETQAMEAIHQAFDNLQKRAREVATAAMKTLDPTASKNDALKRLRSAVAADGVYIALTDLVNKMFEADDVFQTGLVVSVQDAINQIVQPPKKVRHKQDPPSTTTADTATKPPATEKTTTD